MHKLLERQSIDVMLETSSELNEMLLCLLQIFSWNTPESI